MNPSSARLAGVRTDLDVDGLLVLDPDDVRWICGFSGSTGRIVVDPGEGRGWCIVDGRYVERAESEISAHGAPVEVVAVHNGETPDEATVRVADGRRLAVDPRHVTVAHFESLSTRVDLVAAGSNIRDLRRVKSEEEVRRMERAARIADDALCEVVADGLCGRSEIQVRNRLDFLMREAGAEDVAFPTIVASGPNGARPHHEPSDRIIGNADLVVIDMGARVEGYRSDMTRTVTVGSPSAEMQRMLAIVLEAQAAAVAEVRDGIPGRDVHRAARAVFEREGLAHEYLHSTGHGVGLAIHEEPILGPSCTATLRAGEVVTAEPGLYRGGAGGARIEDLVVVTAGTCRTLTLTPKDLSCPPSLRTI